MTPAAFDAAASVVLAWLLTYAIHSTILLTLAAVAAWRLADQHAWLDVILEDGPIAPLVTASCTSNPIAVRLRDAGRCGWKDGHRRADRRAGANARR